MDVIKRLYELEDKEYKQFQAKIVPNISPDTIIGVRVPKLKELAKELNKDSDKESFMKKLPHKYYEENQIHMFLIGMEKDFDKSIKQLDEFLPFADNWAVTDQSSPKSFKKNHEKLLPIIERWLNSDHVYTARYAINVYMREFLDEDFDVAHAELICQKKGDDYYLKMIIAWYFATALAKQYDAVVPYIENNRLETWTHNKAIQKAIESYRVTDENKAYLRTLKRK